MPTISKKTKIKKAVPKKKTSVTKTKTAPAKKKVVKKTVVKKTKKPTPKKANQIVVDIISDDENKFSGFEAAGRVLEPEREPISPVFSSWPNFEKKETTENVFNQPQEDSVEDILEDVEAEDTEEYDKQKKFFSDWAQQNNHQDGAETPSLAPQKKSIGLYRRQAFFYLGATLILLLAVAYFFFVKLTIFISPQGEPINESVSFSVMGSEATTTASSSDLINTNKVIGGELQIKEVMAEKEYPTSEDPISEDTSSPITGIVTLINKYNKNQPLVATTRLLSADGKLYRLKEAVNIPAGGTITASVYADKVGSDMEVAANTRFSIPGLWAGIQDRIYAENTNPLNYSSRRTIKQSDLDRAIKDINEVLNLKVKNEQGGSTDKAIVYGEADEESSVEFDVKLGDEKDKFIATAKKNIVIVSFSKEKIIEMAKARLSLIVSDDKQLSNFNTNQIAYNLESFDNNTKTAEVKAHFTGFMSLKSDSSLINQNKLVGLNEKQISEYLNSFPEIKDYKLEFWPSFIKTAPNLPDRINIKIE